MLTKEQEIWLNWFETGDQKWKVCCRLDECLDRLMSRNKKHGKDEIFFDILDEFNRKCKNFISYGWLTKDEINIFLKANKWPLHLS